VDAWTCAPFEGREALDDLVDRIAAALAARDRHVAVAAQPMSMAELAEPQ
jgi:hypothetical protein